MLSVASLKERIENINSIGVRNLKNKGLKVEDNATTYEIVKKISQIIVGGGGFVLEDIVCNSDNTVTLTETNGKKHTMVCNYENGDLTYVSFDGNTPRLDFVNDDVIAVGITDINLENLSVYDWLSELFLRKTSSANMFQLDDNTFLTETPPLDMPCVKNMTYCFYNNVNLHTIGRINAPACTAYSGAFLSLPSLVEIDFAPETVKTSVSFANSPLLSEGSVQKIIDGLALVEASQTLTLHSAVFLTDEQKNAIQDKGWTLVR